VITPPGGFVFIYNRNENGFEYRIDVWNTIFNYGIFFFTNKEKRAEIKK